MSPVGSIELLNRFGVYGSKFEINQISVLTGFICKIDMMEFELGIQKHFRANRNNYLNPVNILNINATSSFLKKI